MAELDAVTMGETPKPPARPVPRVAPAACSRRGRALRLARIAAAIAAAMLVATAAREVLGDQYVVPTGSMWPTIAPGDRIFVSKAAYGLKLPLLGDAVERSRPALGDVIVFDDPRGGEVPLVKRVVALGGQTIALRRGVLFVDGSAQPLVELRGGQLVERLGAIVHAAGRRDLADYGPMEVPDGTVFVMGDNRAVSLDSRVMGAIPTRLIRGRVLGTVFHYDEAGLDLGRVLREIR